MNSLKMSARRAALVLATLVAGAGLLGAADDATTTAAPSNSANGVSSAAPSQNDEIARLKAALDAQQKQLQALQQMLLQQQQLIEKATTPAQPGESLRPNLGNVASMTPVFPAPAPAPVAMPAIASPAPSPWPQGQGTNGSSANPCEAPPDTTTPAYLRLGNICLAPVGFMDMTGVWRNENPGSGIGSNFGGVPYNNAASGRLSEFRFSIQNSRLGFRIDGNWKGAHFIGYNEFDFLGNSANGVGVTNGAFVPRMRLFWVDVRKGPVEFLAGQSWSMLTPNRAGISALPGNIFFSQVVDVNYVVGLTWTRQNGMRILYHPNDKVTFGLSFENPDQYMGGNAGAPTITLPAAASLSGLGGTQLDNATNTINTPNLHPDIIAKIAFDPNAKFHFEVAGIERTFKIWNSANNSYFSKVGGGVQFGLNAELVKNFRVITTNFYSDGGGRYIFGTGPDVIVRSDGSLSPIHAYGTVDGVEAVVKNTLLYAYYGGAYYQRNTALDANGTTKIGYGFTGSSNAQNRDIQEFTFGFNQTIWRNPRYGAINYMMQYEYLLRAPWYYVAGQAGGKGAKDNTIYLNLRYTLPGASPNFN